MQRDQGNEFGSGNPGGAGAAHAAKPAIPTTDLLATLRYGSANFLLLLGAGALIIGGWAIWAGYSFYRFDVLRSLTLDFNPDMDRHLVAGGRNYQPLFRRYDASKLRFAHRQWVNETDPATGQIHPVTIVTDNGPAFRSAAFARFITGRPELTHVRTRHRSPGTNGVRERGFGTLKYEQLYRHDIVDGVELARHVETQRQTFNTRRPHEALDWRFPQDAYLTAIPNFADPETEPDS